jgi:hypothetical protein
MLFMSLSIFAYIPCRARNEPARRWLRGSSQGGQEGKEAMDERTA